MNDQIEILHMIAGWMRGFSDSNCSKVSVDNDNDSGELMFTYMDTDYILRAKDIRED